MCIKGSCVTWTHSFSHPSWILPLLMLAPQSPLYVSPPVSMSVSVKERSGARNSHSDLRERLSFTSGVLLFIARSLPLLTRNQERVRECNSLHCMEEQLVRNSLTSVTSKVSYPFFRLLSLCRPLLSPYSDTTFFPLSRAQVLVTRQWQEIRT